MKRSLKAIDEKLFSSFLQNRIFKYKLNKVRKGLQASYPFSHIVYYNHVTDNPISILCDKYGSDKGSIGDKSSAYRWFAHTYADFYFNLFSHCRLNVGAVFECGLGTNNPDLNSSMGTQGKPGASLRVWKDYFPNAKIYGADIDRSILFEEDRIKTFYVDQTNSSDIVKMWDLIGGQKFEIIIDDGLHTFEAGITLFEESFENLTSTGIYVIEDVRLEDIPKFDSYFSDKNFNVQIVNLERPGTRLDDNNLIVIRNS